VSLVGQWRELEATLPKGWETAGLRLEMVDVGRTAPLLGPAQPYIVDRTTLRFDVALDGSAQSPDAIVRLLARIDRHKIPGRLVLAGSSERVAKIEFEETSLADQWDAQLAQVPADWSDILAELDLRSTDYIERGSLLCTPLNGRLDGARPALLFRAAASFGYGASAGMVRRCLERCDNDEIRGTVTVLRVLSDSKPGSTQGPVWLMSGKTV
jgi:hypothetical protein